MKFIKGFNESKNPSIFYKVVSESDWDFCGTEVMINPSIIGKLKGVLPSDVKINYNSVSDIRGSSRFRLFRSIKTNHFHKKEINILVKHLEDEWFVLRMAISIYAKISDDSEDEKVTTMYFKCDQFEGLTELLSRTFRDG